MNQTLLEKIYEELNIATKEYYSAANSVVEVKNDIEIARLAKVAAGEIIGKNEDERKANTREFFAVEYAALSACEDTEREAKLRYDLAYQRVEYAKQSIRLMEILKQ